MKTKLKKYMVTQITYTTMIIKAEDERAAELEMKDQMSQGTDQYHNALSAAVDEYNSEEIK